VTFAALLVFVIYETVKTVLFPNLSIISSHIITVIVVAVMTRYLGFTRSIRRASIEK
jgi:hypothetical protein